MIVVLSLFIFVLRRIMLFICSSLCSSASTSFIFLFLHFEYNMIWTDQPCPHLLLRRHNQHLLPVPASTFRSRVGRTSVVLFWKKKEWKKVNGQPFSLRPMSSSCCIDQRRWRRQRRRRLVGRTFLCIYARQPFSLPHLFFSFRSFQAPIGPFDSFFLSLVSSFNICHNFALLVTCRSSAQVTDSQSSSSVHSADSIYTALFGSWGRLPPLLSGLEFEAHLLATLNCVR